ncbi:hypothetical protein J8J40_33535, partial [Mycobacterium tuberculosis]|nr:hypothetical protein [Mycobacterium tuberculosis]
MAAIPSPTPLPAGARRSRRLAWLMRRRGIVLGGALVGLVVLAALCAPLLTGADPYEQVLADALLPPSVAH